MNPEEERENARLLNLPEDEKIALAVVALVVLIALFYWVNQGSDGDIAVDTPIAEVAESDLVAIEEDVEIESDDVLILTSADDQEAGVIELNGVATPGDTLDIYQGNKQIGTATVDRFGKWAYATTLVGAGSYDFSARSRENDSVDQLSLLVGDDGSMAAEPRSAEATATPDPESDTAEEADPDIITEEETSIGFESSINVNGDAAPGDTVDIMIRGNRVGSALVDDNGKWDFNIPYAALLVGRNEIEMVSTETGEPFYTKIINRAQPIATQLKRGYDGLSRPLSQFADSKVTGTGQPNWVVGTQIEGQDVLLVNTDSDGYWETPTTFVAPGEYMLSVWTVNVDGTVLGNSSDRASFTITED